MIRALIAQLAGSLIIVGFAAVWLAATVPRADAATCGLASWYGTESGHRTANGEPFDGRSLTAASRSLPFGTVLIVRNVQNGRSVQVRINDRGPALRTGRFLDLSRAAAARLGMIQAGVAKVCAERL